MARRQITRHDGTPAKRHPWEASGRSEVQRDASWLENAQPEAIAAALRGGELTDLLNGVVMPPPNGGESTE